MAPTANISEIFVSWQGEGPRVGEKHLFVRFAGCNIRCNYCDTPESLVPVERLRVDLPDGSTKEFANPVGAAQLSALVEECCRLDPAVAMIAITGGEPLVQHEFISEWLAHHAPPRPCLLETNAMLPGALAGVIEHVSVVSADIKLPSAGGERPMWDEHQYFLEACSGSELYVKMPVDGATKPSEVARAARLVRETAGEAELFVQPICSADNDRWRISDEELERLVDAAAAELPRVRMLPQVHKLLGVR